MRKLVERLEKVLRQLYKMQDGKYEVIRTWDMLQSIDKEPGMSRGGGRSPQ